MNTDVNIQIGNFEELKSPVKSKAIEQTYALTLRVVKCFLLTSGIIYSLICLMFLLFQNRLIFMPTYELTQVPVQSAHSFTNLVITSSNGQNLCAWYIPAKKSVGTVLYCRGNKGNISEDMGVTESWNRLGYNVMVFDYQGFGMSGGEPSELNCYDDAEAVYNWLRNNRLLNQKIILHGKSIGGAIAAKLANHVKCDGLIIESSFTSIKELGQKRFPFVPSVLYYNDFPTESLLKSLNTPVLVMHSAEDNSIPFSMGQKLFEAAKGEKSFYTLQGEQGQSISHNPGYLRALQTFTGSLKN